MIPRFWKKEYRLLNKIFISSKALASNFRFLQNQHHNALLAPVLKSNAYGHGLCQVAPVLERLKPPFFLVDSLFEAYELSKLNLATPVLIMGYTDPVNYTFKKLPFSFMVSDYETAAVLNKHQKSPKIHLKIDSGMGRYGFTQKTLHPFLEKLKQLSNLTIEGVFTHLSTADNLKDTSKIQSQLAVFKESLSVIRGFGHNPKWRHAAASAGLFHVSDPDFNLVRAGLSLYGIPPFDSDYIDPFSFKQLIPALSFTSRITQIKQLDTDDTVSYGDTFKAQKPTTIALLGAGYFEGVDLRFSNKGSVQIGSKSCPIVGRVCMNVTAVDVSDCDDCKVGDTAIIYSATASDPNSITNVSKTAGTIPYEILVKLNGTIRREIV